MCDNQKLSLIKILITHYDKDDTVLARLCCHVCKLPSMKIYNSMLAAEVHHKNYYEIKYP